MAVAGVLDLDNPWRRLPWSLPLALFICTAVLWELGRILERPPLRQIPPMTIEAELVESPPPVEERIAQPQVKPEPVPPLKKRETPKRAEPQPAIRPVTSSAPEPKPAQEAPAPPAPPPPAPAVPATREAQPAGAANAAARAILRPLPEIPDELRDEAFNAVAVARFQIGADGSATVQLAKPTPNPRLNRLLLEKLRQWRFAPAIRDGQPVASVQEIRIGLEVK
ncbi:MAG TPA: energy transducer TonB [Burkholderiales bacterium]|nr:energy transducer TonB [Burkholderiales bacterium]